MSQDRRRRRFESYRNRSQAVNVVVYDPTGRIIPDFVAAQIINSIDEIARKHDLVISFTRT